MKKTGLLFPILLITTVSFSQIRRIPSKTKAQADSVKTTAEVVPMAEQDNKKNRKEIFKELNLSRDQKIKLKDIKQANQAKMDEVNNDTKLSEQDKKIKIRALRKEQMQNIQSILTDEQKEKFKSLSQKEKSNKQQIE